MNTTAWVTLSFLDLPKVIADGQIPAHLDGERVIWTTEEAKAPSPRGFIRFGMPISDSRLWPHVEGHASINNIELTGLLTEVLIDGAWFPTSIEEALIISAVQIYEVAKLLEAAE